MRLAGQSKLGFYPAPFEAIGALLTHLRNPDRIGTIFDPCAGEGAALEQIRAGLMVGRENTYANELDPERARYAADITKGPTLHGDFKSLKCSPGSFSLVYCNPPFDDEIGGGKREEAEFLRLACPKATPGGIVVLVLPKRVLLSNSDVQQCAGAWLDDIGVYRFPDGYRPYDEAVVIGKRRKLPGQSPMDWFAWGRLIDAAGDLGTDDRVWTLPPGNRPKVWHKGGHTEDELVDAVRTSRIQGLLALRRTAEAPAPPLPLHAGHVSLLLAGGMLDGLVEPSGEDPFVVRGTAQKVQYVDHAKCSSTEDEKGNITEKTVFSERICLHIRCASAVGEIHDFS